LNTDPLTLVEDTENIINKFMEEFDFIEKNFEQDFKDVSKIIKSEQRKKVREESTKFEMMRVMEIARKRQEDKDNKQIKKVGKPMMKRIYAPPVKKLEVKRKVFTEEEEDI